MKTPFQAARRYVAFAALVLLAVFAAGVATPAQAITNCSASASWGTNRAELAAQVIGLINRHRAGKGLSQLAVSSPLTASSEWKSLHMAGNGYFDHNDPAPPVSRTAYQRATDCGYGRGTWGENIAWGYTTAQSVVDGWLGSSGHRANIENAAFTSTGVGVAANAGGKLYWTQNFGNDVAGSTPSAAPQPAPAPAAASAAQATAPGASPSNPAAPPQAAGSAPVKIALRVGAKPASVTRSKSRSRLAASVPFVHLATSRRVTKGSVRCRAVVAGERLRVVANVFKAQAALCAWRIPAWAKGKQLTGIVAVQIDGVAATRLFIRTLE